MSKKLLVPAILLLSTAVAGFAQKIDDPYSPPDPPSICDAIAGNLVMNCGFETGNFTDWTLSGNSGFISITTASNSGNFAGSFGAVGSDTFLTQAIADTAGETLTLHYYLQNDSGGTNDFSARWNGVTIPGSAMVDFGAQPYTEYTFTVTGTGADSLSFAFRQDPSFMQFDDVSLVGAATPEPDSIALLFLVVGISAMVLHKRAARTRTSVS